MVCAVLAASVSAAAGGIETAPFVSVSLAAATATGPGDLELDAGAILRLVAEAYNAGVTHERIRVEFAGPDGRRRGDHMLVHLDPGAKGGGVGRRVAMLAGGLQISVADGLVTAVNRTAVGRAFRAAVDGLGSDQLAGVLPPLPVPSLDFFNAPQGGPESLTPYAPGVRWDPAVLTRAGGAQVVLSGRSPGARVEVVVEPGTWRLLRVDVRGIDADADAGWGLFCTFTRVEAPEVDPFAAPSGDAELVASLAELIPPPRPLRAGEYFTGVSLTDADLREHVPASGPAVLVMYAGHDASAEAAARSALSGLRSAGVGATPAAVLDLAAYEPSLLHDIRERWRPERTEPAFNLSGRAAFDRLDPEADVVLLVLDEARRVRLVRSIAPGDSAGLRESVHAAIAAAVR